MPQTKERILSYLRRYRTLVSLYRKLKRREQAAMPVTARELHERRAKKALQDFFFTGGSLSFPAYEAPAVSVIMVVFNRAELSFAALCSLAQSAVPLEVIVVDNCSTDETQRLFGRVQGARYIRNEENQHFLSATNQGAKQARGKYLLLLNSDAVPAPGALEAALNTLTSDPDAGAVGARLVLPDGLLQEAGSIVWSDGTCLGYGRGGNPEAAPYMFRRTADFCSAAFLLLPAELWQQLGGFDEDYKPAYYEDADLCLRIWSAGKSVIYEPRALVHHFEFGSQTKSETALKMQLERKEIFRAKQRALLEQKFPPSPKNVLPARSVRKASRVLLIDERLPHVHYGAGYPRANEIVRALRDLNQDVTVFPVDYVEPDENWHTIYRDLPAEVEIMGLPPHGPSTLKSFLLERKDYYGSVVISRPTTMRSLRRLLRKRKDYFGNAKLIYDAEALFTLREQAFARVSGRPLSDDQVSRLVAAELALAEGIDAVCTVSPLEAAKFREHGFSSVHVVSHSVACRPGTAPFSERSGLLFVGAIHDDFGPNADSVFWFIEKVLPVLQQDMPDALLNIAGYSNSQRLAALAHPNVKLLGRLDDLSELYGRCKVFIAPTRFSAGIPLKVIEAAAHGIPVAATSLIADQLGWQNGAQLLTGNSESEFAAACLRLLTSEETWNRTRGFALESVAAEYSRERMVQALAEAIK